MAIIYCSFICPFRFEQVGLKTLFSLFEKRSSCEMSKTTAPSLLFVGLVVIRPKNYRLTADNLEFGRREIRLLKSI